MCIRDRLGSIADKGLIFVADIPRDTQVWIKKPQGKQRPRAVGASGATRMDQLKANIAAADVSLSPEVLDGIQQIFMRHARTL